MGRGGWEQVSVQPLGYAAVPRLPWEGRWQGGASGVGGLEGLLSPTGWTEFVISVLLET